MDDVVNGSEDRSNNGALMIGGSILAARIAIGAGIYVSQAEVPPRNPTAEERQGSRKI